MQTRGHKLRDGQVLIVREAVPDDAPAILRFAEATAGESDFLTFGPGEFGYTEAQERAFLGTYEGAHDRLFLIGLVDDAIVSLLSFTNGERPRTRHAGWFGLSVRKAFWGRGVGSLMLDALIAWAQAGGVITKIDLRVRTDHERAIALYQRRGFVVEGTITRAVRIRGEYFDQYWMGLAL